MLARRSPDNTARFGEHHREREWITFSCDNGANIHSKHSETFTPEELGYNEEEWKGLSEEEKNAYVQEWALERYDFWFEEN